MESRNLADLRREYSLQELSETSIDRDPFSQFAAWFAEYLNSKPLEPNAMVLSTAGANTLPSSRVVLLKGFGREGFVFFTNYESAKAVDIAVNPYVSIQFFWPELERQVSIRGSAEKTSRVESEEYFALRPTASQIGAWASKQSSVLSGREELEKRVADLRDQFGDGEIPCPPFWGGFRVIPNWFEFWQGRKSRLHDRICYQQENADWNIFRLSP